MNLSLCRVPPQVVIHGRGSAPAGVHATAILALLKLYACMAQLTKLQHLTMHMANHSKAI